MKKLIFTSLFAAAASLSQAQTANVQIIHNCANPAFDSVSIWINNVRELPKVKFRTATAYLALTAGTPIKVAVSLTTAADTVGAFQFTYTLTANENYVLVASGTGGTTGFSPLQPFDLKVLSGARRSAQMTTNTDLVVFHGSTDAPVVDVRNAADNSVLVNDIAYGNFSSYVPVPTANYRLNVTNSAGTTVVASYQANLTALNLSGASLTVLASGFLAPGSNSNGPAFGLWAATTAGGALVQLPLAPAVSVNEEIVQFENLSVFPNPAQDMLNIAFNTAENTDLSVQISDMIGRTVYTKQLGTVNGQQNLEISTQNLPNGLYQVALLSNKGLTTQKIMIQK
jgi:hypothetical protein